MKKIQIITLIISILAMSLSILSLYFLTKLQTDLAKDLAKIEVKTLVKDCADITWNSSPEPNGIAQSIEYINKCIHMNASLQKTKKLIEASDWSYWPAEVHLPSDIEDTSIFFFKNEVYPGID